MFLASSMRPSQFSLHHSCALAHQRVGAGACDAHGEIGADERRPTGVRMREIERAIVRRAADPLAQRFVPALHQHLANAADGLRVAPDLDGALLLLEDY